MTHLGNKKHLSLALCQYYNSIEKWGGLIQNMICSMFFKIYKCKYLTLFPRSLHLISHTNVVSAQQAKIIIIIGITVPVILEETVCSYDYDIWWGFFIMPFFIVPFFYMWCFKFQVAEKSLYSIQISGYK